ncbi:MAG: hypothetical protein V4692_05920, partial [Bdellovibrionota bacterium]
SSVAADKPKPVSAPVAAGVPNAPTANLGAPSPAIKESTVLIYKADGSLQCGAAKGISVDEMEKLLSGIKTFSKEKRPDGLMHIQVCGSPTGMINVYEISLSQLPTAEKQGFKRFEPR